MNIIDIIKFIGEKNPKYAWEEIKKTLPSIPVEGKGYLDENGKQHGYWEVYDYNGSLKYKENILTVKK